jgi:hypothetical protein
LHQLFLVALVRWGIDQVGGIKERECPFGKEARLRWASPR